MPTRAASTAALVPFYHAEYAASTTGGASDSEELINQLVGGLVKADRSTRMDLNSVNQYEDTGK